MLDIPFIAHSKANGHHICELIDQDNGQENFRRVDFDYDVGQKVVF